MIQFVSAQETADFESLYSDGNTFQDGTAYEGLKFETDGDLGMYYWDQGDGENSSACLYINQSNFGDGDWLTISMDDHRDFEFNSLYFGANFGSSTVNVFGYLDGVKVDSTIDLDISGNAVKIFNYSKVDSVKFVNSNMYVCLDNFSYTPFISDIEAPTILINNGLNLNEGAATAIVLTATDAIVDDATLAYTVTASPVNGQLENSDNPGISISSFIQQNLIDGKIQYVHDDGNTTSDSFTFKVSDGTNELPGQIFNFIITPITPITSIFDGKETEDLIEVYPNPAFSIVNIASEIDLLSMSLINSSGVKIAHEIVFKDFGQFSFDVSSLATGIYFIELNTKEGVFLKKINVQ